MKIQRIILVLVSLLLAGLAFAGGTEVEILGSMDSSPAVVDLTPRTYRIAELPLSVPIEKLPCKDPNAVSKISVDGANLSEAVVTAGMWSPSTYGVYELKHRTTVGGAQAGDVFTVTYEVWSPNIVITDCSVPLKYQLPNTYSNVAGVVIAPGVAKLCANMFSGCAGLTSISLPDGLTSIGANAFAGCTSLARVVVPESVDDFGMDAFLVAEREALFAAADGLIISDGWVLGITDDSVSELEIPEGIIGIGRGALAELYDLESVVLPSTLKYICTGAFRGDTYLDNVEIPEGVERIDAEAFKDCSYIQSIAFSEGLRVIGREAFAGCTQIASVSFDDGLETVGEKAFSGDWRMQSVSLPYSVINVAGDAFTGCSSLTGVTVPTHRGTMSQWFNPIYTQIRNVTIAKGETKIVGSMFNGCTSLATVEIPEGITNVAANAFYGCGALSSAALPRTTEFVGASAFRGCFSLAAMVLPENVATLGANAFYGCSNLRELTLSSGLTAIPDYAFYGCSKLTSFVVPESVRSIGNYICASSVGAIYYLGDAPSFGANAYNGTSSSLTSYVINGTKGWDGRPQSRDLPSSWPVDNSYSRAIAFWTANEFDVIFDANGGLFVLGASETYDCAQITYTPYSLPPYEPILGGAKFMGYWTERTGGTRVTASTAVKLTKAHTLYAHWDVAPSITVRFNANGGTIAEDTAVYTSGVPYGILPVATREHYELVGWFTAANGGRQVTISSEVPSADRELFAHWRPKIYEILYHSNNGYDTTVSQIFTYGDAVALALNRFSCAGCNFAGWSLTPGGEAVYADGKYLGEVSAVQDGTIHLYAVWSGRTYAVRFDSNGGTGTMPNQTFVLGVQQSLTANGFVREGYRFAGWAAVPSGVVAYADGALVVGLTERQSDTVVLYAVWEREGLTLEAALGGPVSGIAVSGDSDWISDAAESHDGVASVCNAELAPAPEGERVSTTLTATVLGSGTGTFWWKVGCEEDYADEWYDYAVFAIDGIEQARVAGEVGWTKVTFDIPSAGSHQLSWTFTRDDFDEPDADFANRLWVDELVWDRDISSYTLADMLNAPELEFTTGGDVQWTPDADVSHDGSVSLRSGAITHSQETWLQTTVDGRGELSFWWKVSGQVNGSRVYDYAKCEVDGVLVAKAGLVDWTNVVVAVDGDGSHTVRWTYLKNVSVDPEGDCAWLDEVSWTSVQEMSVVVPAAISGSADIVITSAWFARFPRFVTLYGADFRAAVLKPNGKLLPGGRPGYVWHDYVVGTDPTDPDDIFTASITMVNGAPQVRWTPDLPPEQTVLRSYRVFGKVRLSDAVWTDVTSMSDISRAAYNFFRVTVEMK